MEQQALTFDFTEPQYQVYNMYRPENKTTAEKVLRAHGDKSWCEKFLRDNTPPYLRGYINHPDPKERQYAPYSLEPYNVDEWNHPKAYGCVVLPLEN